MIDLQITIRVSLSGVQKVRVLRFDGDDLEALRSINTDRSLVEDIADEAAELAGQYVNSIVEMVMEEDE